MGPGPKDRQLAAGRHAFRHCGASPVLPPRTYVLGGGALGTQKNGKGRTNLRTTGAGDFIVDLSSGRLKSQRGWETRK